MELQYYFIIVKEGHYKFQILTGYQNSHVYTNELIFTCKISTTSPRCMKDIQNLKIGSEHEQDMELKYKEKQLSTFSET